MCLPTVTLPFVGYSLQQYFGNINVHSKNYAVHSEIWVWGLYFVWHSFEDEMFIFSWVLWITECHINNLNLSLEEDNKWSSIFLYKLRGSLKKWNDWMDWKGGCKKYWKPVWTLTSTHFKCAHNETWTWKKLKHCESICLILHLHCLSFQPLLLSLSLSVMEVLSMCSV